MKSLVDHDAHFTDLVNYFASYLRDISTTVTNLKALAYTLINLPQPQPSKNLTNADIPSIMTACKKNYDDIKRIQSIIRGHIRGKYIEPKINESRIQTFSSSNTGIAKPQLSSKLSKMTLTGKLYKDFVSNGVQSQRKFEKYKNKSSRMREEQTTSTFVSVCPQIQGIQGLKHPEQNQLHIDFRKKSSRTYENKSETSIKQKDTKIFSSKSNDSLSIISRIRDELQIGKK